MRDIFTKCLAGFLTITGLACGETCDVATRAWANEHAAVRVDPSRSVAPDASQNPEEGTEPTLAAAAGDQSAGTDEALIDVPFCTSVTQNFEMYNPHSEEALKELRQMGFTQVILDWPNLHAAAVQADLNVVLAHWWNHKTSQREIDEALRRARQVVPDRLAGFSVMDEPELNSPETPFSFYMDLYARLRPAFDQDLPTTRIEISHWGPLSAWTEQHYEQFSFLYEAADRMRIMPYPDLHEAPLQEVFLMSRRTRRLMDLAERHIPLVVILQTWVLPPKNQLPTIEELRVMTYLAMLSGADTVSFFDYNQDVWSQSPGFASQFSGMMREVTGWSQRYRACQVITRLGADGILHARLVPACGTVVQLWINTRRESVGNMEPLEIRESVFLSSAPSPVSPLAITPRPQLNPATATDQQQADH